MRTELGGRLDGVKRSSTKEEISQSTLSGPVRDLRNKLIHGFAASDLKFLEQLAVEIADLFEKMAAFLPQGERDALTNLVNVMRLVKSARDIMDVCNRDDEYLHSVKTCETLVSMKKSFQEMITLFPSLTIPNSCTDATIGDLELLLQKATPTFYDESVESFNLYIANAYNTELPGVPVQKAANGTSTGQLWSTKLKADATLTIVHKHASQHLLKLKPKDVKTMKEEITKKYENIMKVKEQFELDTDEAGQQNQWEKDSFSLVKRAWTTFKEGNIIGKVWAVKDDENKLKQIANKENNTMEFNVAGTMVDFSKEIHPAIVALLRKASDRESLE